MASVGLAGERRAWVMKQEKWTLARATRGKIWRWCELNFRTLTFKLLAKKALEAISALKTLRNCSDGVICQSS